MIVSRSGIVRRAPSPAAVVVLEAAGELGVVDQPRRVSDGKHWQAPIEGYAAASGHPMQRAYLSAIKKEGAMKPLIALACICALGTLPAIGLAGNAGDGSDYGTQPGFEVANDQTPCAGHGAFGAFGKDYNLAGGADGYQTGINNSTLCGNRQGNLP